MGRGSLRHIAVVVLAVTHGVPGLVLAADPTLVKEGETREIGLNERLEGRAVTLSYSPASDLATALNQHFRHAGDVEIVAEPVSNSLLISAAPSKMKEVLQLLQVLDQAPRSVVIEATLIEFAAPEDGTVTSRPLRDRDFNGPAGDVAAKIEADVKAGRIRSVRKLRCRTMNNQLAMSSTNEGQGGAPGAAGKGAARPVGAGTPGSSLTATARIGVDNNVAAEIAFLDVRPRTDEELASLVKTRAPLPNDGQKRSDFDLITRAVTTISVASGESAVIHCESTNSASQPSQVMVILSVEVLK